MARSRTTVLLVLGVLVALVGRGYAITELPVAILSEAPEGFTPHAGDVPVLYIGYLPQATSNLRPHMFGRAIARGVEVSGCGADNLQWRDLGIVSSGQYTGFSFFVSSPCARTGNFVTVTIPEETIAVPPGTRGGPRDIYLAAASVTFSSTEL